MYLHPIPSVFIFLLIGRQPYSDDAFFALELARRSAALYGDSRHQEVAVAHSEWLGATLLTYTATAVHEIERRLFRFAF